MHPVWFCIFQLKFFFFCFLKYLRRNLGTDSLFPSKAESKQQFLKRHNANLSSWLLLICLTWTLAPLPVLFYFVNLWALESVVSCCSLSLQMPVYYYPSGQYPTSTTQQYRPIASVQYNAQRSQQIPQTAQQAGICICYSFLELLAVPLLVKPIGRVLILNLNGRGGSWSLVCLKTWWITNWETLCLEIPSNGRAEVAFSTTAVLHAVPRPQCPCSTWRGTRRGGRELVWAVTLRVQANHWDLSFIIQTPPVFVRLHDGQVCSVAEGAVGAPPLSALPEPEERWGGSVWLVPVGTSFPQRRAAGRGAVTL